MKGIFSLLMDCEVFNCLCQCGRVFVCVNFLYDKKNRPVIICSAHDEIVARYCLGVLPLKVSGS